MPYHISKSESCPSSKPYAVIKDADGEIMGCHKTRGDANDQLAALHANEAAEEIADWERKMDEVFMKLNKRD